MSKASSKKNGPVIQFNSIQSGKDQKVRRIIHRKEARSLLDCRTEPPEKNGRPNRKRKPSESEIESENESDYRVSEDDEDGEEKSEEDGEEVEEEVEEHEEPTGTTEESETLDGEKKKKISKKQQKIPIQFPKMDVDEDVYSMKQIPLDFHYKRVVKPGHKDEEWLQIEIDESCIEKTKKTPAIKKVVHIEKNNNFKRTEMMEKVRLHFNDHYDASKSAKNLHEEMIREPTAFQMVALISDDQSKIDKKLGKKACNGEAFDFFEIVRKPTNENPFPFTGKYIIFQSFLKMI